MRFRNKRKRTPTIKVTAHGRRGREIYDELVDETAPPPTSFEQNYPFEWAAGPDATVPELLPSDVDDELLVLERNDEPQSGEELVEFWDQMVKQGRRK